MVGNGDWDGEVVGYVAPTEFQTEAAGKRHRDTFEAWKTGVVPPLGPGDIRSPIEIGDEKEMGISSSHNVEPKGEGVPRTLMGELSAVEDGEVRVVPEMGEIQELEAGVVKQSFGPTMGILGVRNVGSEVVQWESPTLGFPPGANTIPMELDVEGRTYGGVETAKEASEVAGSELLKT